jgi:ATP-binding cassette, subfamily A (ABC1), member 3
MKWLTSRAAAVHSTSEETCDDDVLKEEALVLSGAARSDMIVIRKLTKVYEDGKVAVDNLSLGIASGECFGLLGINGEN